MIEAGERLLTRDPSLAVAPDGFHVGELSCAPPPRGGESAGAYRDAGIALVLAGAVDYRSAAGAATAIPGSVIFANGGDEFSCVHIDAKPNRRLVLFLGADLLNEIAAADGAEDAHFQTVSLAPSRPAAALAALLHEAARGGEDAAFEAAHMALRMTSERPAVRVSRTDAECAREAANYIRSHFAESCGLTGLAARAGLSRYHFGRVFKAVTGVTPAQYVIHTRLTEATWLLENSAAAITELAFSVGFNDLSHFNLSFKAAYGCTPSVWRRRNRRRARFVLPSQPNAAIQAS